VFSSLHKNHDVLLTAYFRRCNWGSIRNSVERQYMTHRSPEGQLDGVRQVIVLEHVRMFTNITSAGHRSVRRCVCSSYEYKMIFVVKGPHELSCCLYKGKIVSLIEWKYSTNSPDFLLVRIIIFCYIWTMFCRDGPSDTTTIQRTISLALMKNNC
jgi:hypothetical protein